MNQTIMYSFCLIKKLQAVHSIHITVKNQKNTCYEHNTNCQHKTKGKLSKLSDTNEKLNFEFSGNVNSRQKHLLLTMWTMWTARNLIHKHRFASLSKALFTTELLPQQSKFAQVTTIIEKLKAYSTHG